MVAGKALKINGPRANGHARHRGRIPHARLRRLAAYAHEIGVPPEAWNRLGRDEMALEAFLEAVEGDFIPLARAIARCR